MKYLVPGRSRDQSERKALRTEGLQVRVAQRQAGAVATLHPSLRLHTHLHSLPFDPSLHIIHQPPGHPEARGPTIPFPSINHNQSGIMHWSPTIHRSPHSSRHAFTARPLTITSPSTRSSINPPSSLPSPIHLPTHSLSAIPSSFHIPHPPPIHPPCTHSLCSPVHPPIHLYLVITLFASSQPPPFY